MVLDRVVQRFRTSGPNPATPNQGFGWNWSTRTHSGQTVTNESAMGLTAAYRGVSMLASLLGSLPIDIFEKDVTGKRVDVAGPTNENVWLQPNPEMSRQTFYEASFGQEILGDCFWWVDKASDAVTPDLWPLDSEKVRTGRDPQTRRKVYEIDRSLPMIDYADGGEIIHIPNFSSNGFRGINPFKVGAESLGIGLSAQEYAARFYSQADQPPGYLTSDQVLTNAQAVEIGDRWNRLHAGISRAMRTAVLGAGAKYIVTGLDPATSQLYEARKFSVSEVARLLGLPPHLLADVERSTSWGAGIEEQNRGLMTFTGNAHITRFELAIDANLLRRRFSGRYSKFKTAALFRGNLLQRYQAYRLATFMTENEKRALEEMEPLPGGDELLAQTNLAPIEQVAMGADMSNNGNPGNGPDNAGNGPMMDNTGDQPPQAQP